VVVPLVAVGFGAAAFDGRRSHDDASPAQIKAQTMLESFREVVEGVTDGVQELDAAPDDTLKFGYGVTGIEDEDDRLTSWWRVPEPADEVLAYLRAHRLDGAQVGPDSSGTSMGVTTNTVTYDWASTDAYAAPALFVTLERDGDSTDLVARTSIAPRPARAADTVIDSPVSGVDLTVRRGDRLTTRQVDDAGQVEQLVAAFNALRASPTTKMSYVTGGVGLDSRATLVTGMRFHLATGEVSVRLETDGALVTVALSTPGTPGSSLDGGLLRGGFMTTVEKIVGLRSAS